MRRLLPLLVAALCCAAAAPAHAAPITLKKSMWGPIERGGVSQFPIYADLGVGIWQYTIRWDQVAPTRPADPANFNDPAYVWPADLDRAIAEAKRYGIKVAPMVLGAPAGPTAVVTGAGRRTTRRISRRSSRPRRVATRTPGTG